MTTLREAAQQALEALETLVPRRGGDKYSRAASALRKALAQQAEPAPGWCKHCKQYSIEEPLPAQQAEPKIGLSLDGTKWHGRLDGSVFDGPKQAEPVAWIDLLKVAEEIVKAKPLWKRFIDGTPLANDIPVWMADFASEHCTAPPQRKPLTEGEIERHIGYRLPAYSMRLLLELVNGRAHGIGGDDGQA